MTRSPKKKTWQPLSEEKLARIRTIFESLFADDPTAPPTLAKTVGDYWVAKLGEVWQKKPDHVKQKDLAFRPEDPLSRIEQKTVVITYADSVYEEEENSLNTLDAFLGEYFPAIGGMHMLPACQVAAERFNDGYFSQVVRDRIHPAFGSNRQFAAMMGKYYSMADFVLNHVDIENPAFQAYLAGDDDRGDCFYVFTEEEYQKREILGDFKTIFRPRPFPLFTIFRRRPLKEEFRCMDFGQKTAHINGLLAPHALPEPLIGLFSIFNKIRNDQMLLDEDYGHITAFREYLQERPTIDEKQILTVSAKQETQHTPYIFQEAIATPEKLLLALGYDAQMAGTCADIYRRHDPEIFGEEIRALTTFSHVQVDLNTATEAGLKMLADDFAWYLGMDLNMLRLDAANFAFKRWGSTCFGLPEVKQLMEILYLSIDCVSPRIVANLEVNDTLTSILTQMADKKAPPPMMYDFHLAAMLPTAFNSGDASFLARIFEKIAQYDIPLSSIRFSLAESHDGKSVRGSMDLMDVAQRQMLADTVVGNGGYIKYKSVPRGEIESEEFRQVCEGAGMDYNEALSQVFQPVGAKASKLKLRDDIVNAAQLLAALDFEEESLQRSATLRFLVEKTINGQEPYELCSATWHCLTDLKDDKLATCRYLAFYTLAFALMGRNVKSIYFNDLLGLGNDHQRLERSGELRDLKRTKSPMEELKAGLARKGSNTAIIAAGLNNLIALVDHDPALHYRGQEARLICEAEAACPVGVALVTNHCGRHRSLAVVNLRGEAQQVVMDASMVGAGSKSGPYDNIAGDVLDLETERIHLALAPYQRMWLTADKIAIPPAILV